MESTVQPALAPITMTQMYGVLPSQHFGPQRNQAPEQRLMMAVLQDALECVEKYRHATSFSGERLYQDARRWFVSEEGAWPYSFESICGYLNLDAAAVRQRLRLGSLPKQTRCSVVNIPRTIRRAVMADETLSTTARYVEMKAA